jgi:hypothetical protein
MPTYAQLCIVHKNPENIHEKTKFIPPHLHTQDSRKPRFDILFKNANSELVVKFNPHTLMIV